MGWPMREHEWVIEAAKVTHIAVHFLNLVCSLTQVANRLVRGAVTSQAPNV